LKGKREVSFFLSFAPSIIYTVKLYTLTPLRILDPGIVGETPLSKHSFFKVTPPEPKKGATGRSQFERG